MNDGDYGIGVFTGALLLVITLLVVWHMREGACQRKYNVYDCEAADNMFQPVLDVAE